MDVEVEDFGLDELDTSPVQVVQKNTSFEIGRLGRVPTLGSAFGFMRVEWGVGRGAPPMCTPNTSGTSVQ
jgi:hypothetical protein